MSHYCLVYTSISNQKMSDDDLGSLLNKSRSKNAILNITGMLLYLDPFFLQILEGEEESLDEIFNMIKQDSRHYKIKIIYKKQLDDRFFPNWTMGFSRINREHVESIEGFTDFLQQPTSTLFHHSHGRTQKELEHIINLFKEEVFF